jgi:hypothetical protein
MEDLQRDWKVVVDDFCNFLLDKDDIRSYMQ